MDKKSNKYIYLYILFISIIIIFGIVFIFKMIDFDNIKNIFEFIGLLQ